MWQSVAGDQTEEAYSTIGRTYVLYALALASRGLDLIFRRRKAMVEFGFFVMLSMWNYQDNSGMMVTPKYFACSVDRSVV